MRRMLFVAWLSAAPLAAQFQLFVVQPGQADQIAAVPPQFSFGICPVGDVRDVQFQLQNNGTGPAQLTVLSVTAPFSIPYEPALPITVPAGGTVDFTISFAPAQGGSFSATFTADGISEALTGNATSAVAVAVGDGSGTTTPLAPGASIDFGSLAQGSMSSQQVVMSNPGNAAIIVQNVAVVNLEGAAFQLKNISLPISLPPGGSTVLVIEFSPGSTGPQQGALEVDQLDIPLTGIGLSPPFPQPVILVSIPSVASSEQGSLTVSLPSPSQASGTGQVRMAFTPLSAGANPDDGMIFLLSGSQTAPFTVNQGDTAARFGNAQSAAFQTGTTAGTIVFSVPLGQFTETYSLTIPGAPPEISTTTAQYTSGGLDVELTGFDNTRTASTISFTFRDRSGARLGGGPITVNGTSNFGAFFASSQEGGIFALHAFFPVIAGNPDRVNSVEIQMTNSAGVSSGTEANFTTR